MNTNIYIACSLTHVPRDIFTEYTEFIHSLAHELNDFSVKYALVNSDPQLEHIPANEKAKYCYLWDRKMVEEAGLVIAEASFPSIGLGIELQIAEAANIPVVLLYRDEALYKAPSITYTNPDDQAHELQIGDGFVSLMALGLPNVIKIISYKDLHSCVGHIKDVLKNYMQQS